MSLANRIGKDTASQIYGIFLQDLLTLRKNSGKTWKIRYAVGAMTGKRLFFYSFLIVYITVFAGCGASPGDVHEKNAVSDEYFSNEPNHLRDMASVVKKGEKTVAAAERQTALADEDNALLRTKLKGDMADAVPKREASAEERTPDGMTSHYYYAGLEVRKRPDSWKIDNSGKRPVILVVLDAINAEHMGVYGSMETTTPNLNQLAKEGVVLTDWVSNSSWTRPSFTTILTGVPKNVHGMELNDRKLPAHVQTLGERFKKKGYRTGAFIGNPLIQKKWLYHQGFDIFKDAAEYGDFPRAKTIVEDAIDWMEKVKGSDFLCVLFITDTHAPYNAPENERLFSKNQFNVIRAPKKESVHPLTDEEVAGIKAAYNDELHYVDKMIGQLVEWLHGERLWTEVALVVTGDHGEIFGDHDCFQHAWHMWEPVLRVPFIVHSTNVGEQGVFEAGGTHTDIAPTLMHLAGLGSKTKWGQSVFVDIDDRTFEKVILSAYDAQGVKRQAARKNGMKLIRYENVDWTPMGGKHKSKEWQENPSLQIPGPRYELYDLNNDPGEQHNIFAEADKQAASEKRWLNELKDAARFVGKPTKKGEDKPVRQLDDETLDALKAAGYIE
ncbi:MAG: sulfatase [Deltaproteobacteria bacterium]|nr:sulfatase [Deltaproteobacteria bacterium]